MPNKSLTRNFCRQTFEKFFHINFYFVVYLQGGEVVQQTITSNIHDDIIILEFQRTDGTLITQLIDFRSVSIARPFPSTATASLPPHRRPFFPRALADGSLPKFNLNVSIMIWLGDKNKVLLCVLLKCFCRPGERTRKTFIRNCFYRFCFTPKKTLKMAIRESEQEGKKYLFLYHVTRERAAGMQTVKQKRN